MISFVGFYCMTVVNLWSQCINHMLDWRNFGLMNWFRVVQEQRMNVRKLVFGKEKSFRPCYICYVEVCSQKNSEVSYLILTKSIPMHFKSKLLKNFISIRTLTSSRVLQYFLCPLLCLNTYQPNCNSFFLNLGPDASQSC